LELYGFEPLAVALQQQSSARYRSISLYRPIMRADIGSESRHRLRSEIFRQRRNVKSC
jgi:hypothetical protein